MQNVWRHPGDRLGHPGATFLVLVQTLQAVGIPGDNGQMRALDLFKGRHFNWEVIVLCVRWYLGFKLSSRDLVQMMAERGICVDAHHDSALGTALCTGV
jgi:hypothetical protein